MLEHVDEIKQVCSYVSITMPIGLQQLPHHRSTAYWEVYRGARHRCYRHNNCFPWSERAAILI